MGKILDIVLGYLKGRTWWPRVEPFVLVVLVGGATQVFAFEWVAGQYGLRQPPAQFLASYLSLRITLVTLVALLLAALFTRNGPEEAHARRRQTWYRSAAVAVSGLIVIAAFMLSSTHRASKITIRIGSLPAGARVDALTYVIYELNRIQRDWYFEIDFTEFNLLALKRTERDLCDRDAQPLLCHAERMAGAQDRTILISNEPLASEAFFSTHHGRVSVISTAEEDSYEPLTVYEYVAYLIIVQSITIHLDEQRGLPDTAFVRTGVSRGGVLQFVPQRDALRPTMLAARLSPEEELLLFNYFGPSYLATCQRLLTLEWLYTPGVRTNLSKLFKITLGR